MGKITLENGQNPLAKWENQCAKLAKSTWKMVKVNFKINKKIKWKIDTTKFQNEPNQRGKLASLTWKTANSYG